MSEHGPGGSPPAAPADGPAGVRHPFGRYPASRLALGLWRLADRRWPGRLRLRRTLACLVPEPLDVAAEGLLVRAYPGQNHDDRVIVSRGRLPDRDERACLAPFLGEGGVFVDVGANIGSYALWAARRVGPGGRVVACEPHPVMRRRLAANARLNGFAQIEIVPEAVGAGEGWRELHMSAGGNSGQSSLHREIPFGATRSLVVRVRPLRDLVAWLGVRRIDVMKLDVEGYEDRVLVPFLGEAPAALLPRAVVLETSVRAQWRESCEAALAARGYEALLRTDDNLVLALPEARLPGR